MITNSDEMNFMKISPTPRIFFLVVILVVGYLRNFSGFAQTAPTNPAPNTTVQPSPKPTPPPATAKDLIAQGIQLYRKVKYDQAAKKFAAALKLEPANNDALGYASLTAYQLGNQAQARELFQRRADLPNQTNSVKAFCSYMIALTRWRQSHEIIAKRGNLTTGKTVYKMTDKELAAANEHVTAGITSVNKALAIKPDYAEAFNILNLLHAEAAAIATDEAKANEQRKAALTALRQAIKFHKAGATNDFGAPTIQIGEFATTEEEQEQMLDPMFATFEGGKPLTRAGAVLPVVKTAKPKPVKTEDGSPAPSGVGATGGAVSVGPGRGALKSSKQEVVQLKGGKAKVEVLISTTGQVVFARILDGPAATTGPALAAAKKWVFSAAKFEGQPVQVSGVITFNVKSSGGSKSKTK